MVKPIFTIGVTGKLSSEEIINIEKIASEKLKNAYFVFVYTHNSEDVKFQCFNVKNIDDINEEEFKKEIKKLINNGSTKRSSDVG